MPYVIAVRANARMSVLCTTPIPEVLCRIFFFVDFSDLSLSGRIPRKVTLWKLLYARFTTTKYETCWLERTLPGSVYMFTPAQCMLRMLIREGIGMGEVLPSDLISPFKLSYHYGVLLNVVKHLRFERHSKILQGFNFTAINK